MRRERRPPRLVAALLLSLLAHLAVLVALRGAAPVVPRPPARAPLELEIVHVAPDPPVREPAAAPGAPPAHRGAAPRAQEAGDASDGAAVGLGVRDADVEGAAVPEAAAVVHPPAAAGRGRDAEVEGAAVPEAAPVEESIAGMVDPAGAGAATAARPAAPGEEAPALPRRLDLIPDRLDLAASAPAPAPSSGETSDDEAPGPAPHPGEGLAALLADDRAVARATTHLHDHWASLRRHLASRWEVDRALLRDGPRRGIGVKIDEAFEAWQEQARRYAATGNPYGEGLDAPGVFRPRHDALPSTLPEPNPLPENDDGFFRRHRTALVLVEQDASGAVVDVRLHRSSGSPAYDRHALAQARALRALDLAPPPDGSKSLWAFDATLIITPPLPIAGCAVDAYFLPEHCFHPLSERVKTDVRLVGVWMADEAPGRF